MLSLFVSIVVPLIVLFLVMWIVGLVFDKPDEQKIVRIVRMCLLVAVVLWLLAFFLGYAPGYSGFGDIPSGRTSHRHL